MPRLSIRQTDQLLDELKLSIEERIRIKTFMVNNKMMDDNFRNANPIRKLIKFVASGGQISSRDYKNIDKVGAQSNES